MVHSISIKARKEEKMKKIAMLLVFSLLLGALFGFTVSAEEIAEPSVEIAFYTVPMRATVSIFYAVKADGYTSDSEVVLCAQKENSSEVYEVPPSGVTTIGGERYLVFEFSELSAAEMDVSVTAYVRHGDRTSESPKTYSVMDFADAYANGNGSEKNKALVAAMIAYGDAVKALTSKEVEG